MHRYLSVLTLLFILFCNQFVCANPRGEEIWQTYLVNGDTEEALSAFAAAVENDETDFTAHAGLGYLTPSRPGETPAWKHFIAALKHGAFHPEATLFLLEASEQVSDPESINEFLSELDKLLQDNSVPAHLQDQIKIQKARLLRHIGKWDAGKKVYQELGFIDDFMLLGPFDNAEKSGHAKKFAPEDSIELNAEYEGKRRTINWRPLPSFHNAYINLNHVMEPSNEVSSYLATTIQSDESQKVRLSIGHAGALKVWLNGKLVANVDRYHKPFPDQVNISDTLNQGTNTLLIKISSDESGQYGLFVRMKNEITGEQSFTINSGKDGDSDYSNHVLVSNDSLKDSSTLDPIPIRQLKALGDSDGTSPYMYLFFAMLVERFGVLDDHDQSVPTILTQFNTTYSGNPLLLRLLGEVEKVDNRRRVAFQTAYELDSDDQAVFLKLLRTYRHSPYGTKGIDLLHDWETSHEVPPQARILQAQMLNQKGLNDAAYNVLDSIKDESSELLWEKYQLARNWDTDQDSKKILTRILDKDPMNLEVVSHLISIALRQNDEESLNKLLEHEQLISPHSLNGKKGIMRKAQGAGDYEKVIEIADEILNTNPDHYESYRLKAVAYANMNQKDQALAAIEEAIKTRPSDPWCQDYLNFLQTEVESYAEPYLKKWQDIEIPNSLDVSQANYVKLLDQKVVKVHSNGNSSQTVRDAIKVLTDSGVQMLRARGLYYTGNQEEIRVKRARVWKPDGTFFDAPAPSRRSMLSEADADAKLYGDTHVAILQFPGLEKGCVIDVEYETISRTENIYADYFGDQFFIGDGRFEPAVMSEYVLITPTNRQFYHHYTPPNYPDNIDLNNVKLNPTPEISEQGSEKIYHWTFSQLPDLPTEPMMPAASEILPYLKISTFETWDEMTTWYWNLIEDQLKPGEVTKQTVDRILTQYRAQQGLDVEAPLSDWDKVRAINAFINTGIRYLGLEFGIHGYKPHKVDEICNAQYGDCKDKAALAVAMLKEVGIEARMVILRTTDRGEIDYDLPMLGIFNHAIYYLPNIGGKEIWIDGTATFYGVDELPPGDEGSNSLIVHPGGDSEFIRIPQTKAQGNGAYYTTTLKLDNNGNATGTRVGEYEGLYNPIIRRTYENATKAKEMVDQVLASQYPGSESSNLRLSDLEDYSNAEQVSYDLNISNLGVKRDDQIIVPSVFFPENLSQRYAQLSQREYDLVVSYSWHENNRIEITLPADIQNVDFPDNKTLDTAFGRYERKIQREGNQLIIDESLIFNASRVDTSEYADFREFCRLVDDYQDEKITVTLE